MSCRWTMCTSRSRPSGAARTASSAPPATSAPARRWPSRRWATSSATWWTRGGRCGRCGHSRRDNFTLELTPESPCPPCPSWCPASLHAAGLLHVVTSILSLRAGAWTLHESLRTSLDPILGLVTHREPAMPRGACDAYAAASSSFFIEHIWSMSVQMTLLRRLRHENVIAVVDIMAPPAAQVTYDPSQVYPPDSCLPVPVSRTSMPVTSLAIELYDGLWRCQVSIDQPMRLCSPGGQVRGHLPGVRAHGHGPAPDHSVAAAAQRRARPVLHLPGAQNALIVSHRHNIGSSLYQLSRRVPHSNRFIPGRDILPGIILAACSMLPHECLQRSVRARGLS